MLSYSFGCNQIHNCHRYVFGLFVVLPKSDLDVQQTHLSVAGLLNVQVRLKQHHKVWPDSMGLVAPKAVVKHELLSNEPTSVAGLLNKAHAYLQL
jgi:hypothetical protein